MLPLYFLHILVCEFLNEAVRLSKFVYRVVEL